MMFSGVDFWAVPSSSAYINWPASRQVEISKLLRRIGIITVGDIYWKYIQARIVRKGTNSEFSK